MHCALYPRQIAINSVLYPGQESDTGNSRPVNVRTQPQIGRARQLATVNRPAVSFSVWLTAYAGGVTRILRSSNDGDPRLPYRLLLTAMYILPAPSGKTINLVQTSSIRLILAGETSVMYVHTAAIRPIPTV